MSPVFPNSIEVFDLAENQDLSPLELDPEKLAHKYKEVYVMFNNCITPSLINLSQSYLQVVLLYRKSNRILDDFPLPLPL